MLMGILMQCPSLRADVQLADCSASLFFDSFAARILQVEDEQVKAPFIQTNLSI